MKKPLMKSLLVAFSALLATSVVPLSSAQANDTLGQKVQYDTKAPVNDGKDISIQYWTWNDGDPAIKLAESYQKLHPNVKIEVVNHPWDDYWTKLPLALQGSDGPAIFNIHNSQDKLLSS